MLAVEYMLRKQPTGVRSLILSGPYLSSPWGQGPALLDRSATQKIKQTILECEANKDFTHPDYQEAVMAFYRRHLCRMDPWPAELLESMEGMGVAVYQYMWGPSEFTLTGTLKEADLTPRLHLLHLPSC